MNRWMITSRFRREGRQSREALAQAADLCPARAHPAGRSIGSAHPPAGRSSHDIAPPDILSPLRGRADMTLRRTAGWLAIAFLVWFAISRPVPAAHVVHNIGSFLSHAAAGLSRFVSQL
jgi:hypothetical protein